MSRGQTLRALVNERLAAAAEDIFVLFERTIKEFEEELCRSKEENQRKQQLLDKYLRMELVRRNVQISSMSHGPGLNQEIAQTPQIKGEPEEQSVKKEEEQLPVPVPDANAVCVKTEESSVLQQRQPEHQEEMQGEDISSETERHTERWPDTDDHWEPFSFTAAQMETEADGDHYNQVQIRDRSSQNNSATETSVHSGHMSGADVGAAGEEWKKHQCFVCNKRFGTKQNLQNHIRVHTGERPYSCSNCNKQFADPSHFRRHKKTHTGEKPYSCSICEKTFSQKVNLDSHAKTHTGERPYICPICERTFARKDGLKKHMNIHQT